MRDRHQKLRRRRRPARSLVVCCLAIGGLLAPARASAQEQAGVDPPAGEPSHAEHVHGVPDRLPGLCLGCPAARESSGTSWQPDATEDHVRERAAGAWRLRTHADLAVVAADERGPRGGREVFSTNHVMFAARRPVRGGVFGVQSMWSLEPTMGPRGYPLLLQTGETADGVTPLFDRQHPHDLSMELAVTYARPFGDDQSWFVYVAAVGAPAFGPPPFMHRASAAPLPVSPITHHWLDSTHLGVAASWSRVGPELREEYGGPPASVLGFLTIRAH